MISIKPASLNAQFTISDNLDPDSNVTEESDLHLHKHSVFKTSTDAGIWTNFKPVFENIPLSICFNLEPFSKTTDVNLSLPEMLSDEMNSIREGIQRVLPEKCPPPTAETNRITPSVTINRGQNSPAIFQTTREVCDLGFAIEFEFELESFNGLHICQPNN
jgi:hypothetical protein